MDIPQSEMQKKMRRIGITMNILMGFSISLVLSLVGVGFSGHFTIQGWLVSFAGSFILSLIIGFCLPVRKCIIALSKKLGLRERSVQSLFLDSLISDIFYTPLITLLMVFLGYQSAMRGINSAIENGVPASAVEIPEFLPMFLHSLLISMIVGYFLIMILQPLFLKILIKKPVNADGR